MQTITLSDTNPLLPGLGGPSVGFGVFASGGTFLTSVTISLSGGGLNGFGLVLAPSIATVPAPGTLALLMLPIMRSRRRRR